MERNRVIRDAVHGVSEIDARFRCVLDTVELQRLRWIRQTGLAYLVYPGAEHSRFAHALGTYAIATRVFLHLRRTAEDFLEPLSPSRLDDDLMRAFQTAALCHDLGHTAFSHVFEPMLLPNGSTNHEGCTLRLLRDKGTEISKAIRGWCDVDDVVQLLTQSHWMLGLCHLLAGEYDVDRWDYLLRDARATGVQYGRYDLQWMIHSLLLTRNTEGRPLIALDARRGIVALRQFLGARRYMYSQIYWHTTVRGAERMLRAIFERATDANRSGLRTDPNLVPRPLRRPLLDGVRPSIGDFLTTDDAVVLSAVKNWAEERTEPVLSYLARSFLSRRLFKEIRLPREIRNGGMEIPRGMLDRVKEAVKDSVNLGAGREAPDDSLDYLVLQDLCQFNPENLETMYFDFDGELRRPSEMKDCDSDFRFADLGEGFKIRRLFVPAEARETAQKALP